MGLQPQYNKYGVYVNGKAEQRVAEQKLTSEEIYLKSGNKEVQQPALADRHKFDIMKDFIKATNWTVLACWQVSFTQQSKD